MIDTFYINGQEFAGVVTDYDFEDHMAYGKNERVRYKNFKHAVRLISKLVKEKN